MGKLAGKDDDIIEQYLNGATGDQLGKQYNCTRQSIYTLLDRNGIKRRQQVNYPVNEHYFDKIDHPNKAYLLGFIAGDGYNSRKENRLKIELAGRDKEILDKFKNILSCSEKPLYKSSRDGTYTLSLYSKHLSKQLENLGIMQNKTFKVRVPFKHIKGYESHFFRGIFDSDGGLYKSGHWRFLITGNHNFIQDLCNLVEDKLELKFEPKGRSYTEVCDLKTGGKNNIYKLLEWIYKDAELYLERKYLKAEEFFDEWS